jgi:hypothetical protein
MVWPFEWKYSRKLERISLDFIAKHSTAVRKKAGCRCARSDSLPKTAELRGGNDGWCQLARDRIMQLHRAVLPRKADSPVWGCEIFSTDVLTLFGTGRQTPTK